MTSCVFTALIVLLAAAAIFGSADFVTCVFKTVLLLFVFMQRTMARYRRSSAVRRFRGGRIIQVLAGGPGRTTTGMSLVWPWPLLLWSSPWSGHGCRQYTGSRCVAHARTHAYRRGCGRAAPSTSSGSPPP